MGLRERLEPGMLPTLKLHLERHEVFHHRR